MSKLAFLKESVEELSAEFGEDNPFVKDLRQQIATFNEPREKTILFGQMTTGPSPEGLKAMQRRAALALGDRFERALGLAAHLHRNQVRKGTTVPYISHLLAVAALVLENGGDEDQAIAALLHDAVEDQGGEPTLQRIEAEFGEGVARIVADCTDAWVEPKPPWRERKEHYLAHLPHVSERSLLVSLADKVHNASSILADHRVVGAAVWERFKAGRDGTLWYYAELSRIFDQLMPGRLASELDRLISHLEQCE